jgi:hypothetical protein
MKNRFMIVLGLTLAGGSAAYAAPPLSPTLLGEVDGILASCAKIDPRDEEKFQKLRQSLMPAENDRGRRRHVDRVSDRDSKDDRESMEKDPGYRATFTLMQGIFNTMPPGDALKLCKDAVSVSTESPHNR